MLLPVVLVYNAIAPVAVFELPVVLKYNATLPTAVFSVPVVLLYNVCIPKEVIVPLVLLRPASKPTAVLFDAVFDNKA